MAEQQIVIFVESGDVSELWNNQNGKECEPTVTADSKIPIWVGKKTKKAVEVDSQATKILLGKHLYNKLFWMCFRTTNFMTVQLGFVKDHWAQLNDNKTGKKKVWEAIAKKMESHNYCLGPDPPLKCDQKWQNLLKPIRKYAADSDKTGSAASVHDNPPPFYEEIMEIMGNFLRLFNNRNSI